MYVYPMQDLKQRTKKFAIDCIGLCRKIQYSPESKVITNQLLRSSTAVAANYRAACRLKSRADFIAKITTVEEEADESQFWLELIQDASIFIDKEVDRLQDEAGQLTAIFASSAKTAKANNTLRTKK